MNIESDFNDFLTRTKLFSEGRPLKIHQVLAHHPRVGRALNGFLEWGEDAVLSPRERRLIILRTAGLARCSYELNIHRRIGVSAGDVTEEEASELESADYRGARSRWSDRERALLEIADAICVSDTLDDDQWRSASTLLSAAEIIECLLIVGFYRMCAGLMNALGVPAEYPPPVA